MTGRGESAFSLMPLVTASILPPCINKIMSYMNVIKENLPLRADALCAETMSIDHRVGAMDATHGQGKERKLWQK